MWLPCPVRVLLAGGGGREAAIARRLAEDSEVCAVMPHENPGIRDACAASGGEFMIGDPADPAAVASFAREARAGLAFVSADQPLANGVADALAAAGVPVAGATRGASRIEWDKAYAAEMVAEVCPEISPFHRIVRDGASLDRALAEFEGSGRQVVVKPQGLTGGKGVKVMPEHLGSYGECAAYARDLLAAGGSVLLVERLAGPEFTVMGFTDGTRLELAPATYDYPYRLEGDRGPGTGGMGCLAGPDPDLPFMGPGDTEACRRAMLAVLEECASRGHPFTGVINGGFFKTPSGLRFMEFNARLGDPEAINVLDVLEGSLAGVISGMAGGNLGRVQFARRATVTKYLVPPEYPSRAPPREFTAGRMGGGAYLVTSSCTGGDGRYVALGASRAAAVCASAPSVGEASRIVEDAIQSGVGGQLEHRADIGTPAGMPRGARA